MNSMQVMNGPLSMQDKNYSTFYTLDDDGKDQIVLQHPNKLYIVGISPNHPICKGEATVLSVNFNVAEKNRLDNKLKGKKKKGAQKVEIKDFLCEVMMSDGTQFFIDACVKGSLLEVNENLLHKPNLLKEKCCTDGYVAIIQPNKNDSIECNNHLIESKEYHRIRSVL